jgi:hypothetical protein
MSIARVSEYSVVLNSAIDSAPGILTSFLYLTGSNYVSCRVALGRRKLNSKPFVAVKFILIALIQLLHLASKRKRDALRHQISKSRAVLNGQVLMLKEFLGSQSETALLLEDDFYSQSDLHEIVNHILEQIPDENSFGVEVSDSFSFQELGIEPDHLERTVNIGLTSLFLVYPGSSNTTCAAIYSRPGASLILHELERFRSRALFKSVPVDLLISFIYLRKKHELTSYHLVPGPVKQLSDFRRGSWYVL